MGQVVYVLTGDSATAARPYLEGMRLSILSLRRVDPDVVVHCFCDLSMDQYFRSNHHSWIELVDRWVVCAEATGGAVHRSRFIKTSLRGRISGPFVYLDTDSVVTGPLDELFACKRDFGLTLDRFFPDRPGAFPGWLASHYRRLGWSPSENYCAGGVFWVADNAQTHRFCETWHARWRETVQMGLVADQPSLNRAVAEVEPGVELYPETFNFLVGRVERPLPTGVRLVSFLASQGEPPLVEYQALLERLGTGGHVPCEELMGILQAGTILPKQSRTWLTEWKRRFSEATQQTAARLGLRDASNQ